MQDHIIGTQHIFAFATLLASKGKIRKLAYRCQELLRECALEAGIEVSKAQVPIIQDYIQMLLDEGMEWHDIDRDTLKAKMGPVREWFVKEYGDEYITAIENL